MWCASIVLAAAVLRPGPQETTSAPPETPAEPIAFEVLLLGLEDHAQPITVREWDEYSDHLRTMSNVTDEGMLVNEVLRALVPIRLAQMYFHERMPGFQKRVNTVVRKLKRGVPFGTVVKRHTDDKGSRPIEGLLGEQGRGTFNYPANVRLFQADVKVGDWVGPLMTKAGAEFYYIENKTGAEGSAKQRIQPRMLFLKYGNGMSSTVWTEVWAKTRIRVVHDRFRRVIPPGLQLECPPTFGPADVAPLGDPERVLLQHSERDDLHDTLRKPRVDSRIDSPANPVNDTTPSEPEPAAGGTNENSTEAKPDGGGGVEEDPKPPRDAAPAPAPESGGDAR